MKKLVPNLFALFFLLGYTGMVFFALTYVKDIKSLPTYNPTIIFSGIDIAILFAVAITAINAKMHIGFKAPLIMLTVLYTFILDILVFYGAEKIEQTYFVLANGALLMIYGIAAFPLCIMAYKKSLDDKKVES